jgi:hypothetical protein
MGTEAKGESNIPWESIRGRSAIASLPWEVQGLIDHYLRVHRCAVTVANRMAIAEVIRYRQQRGPITHAELEAMLDKYVDFS